MALHFKDVTEFTLPVFQTLTYFRLLHKEPLVLCCKPLVLLLIRCNLVKTGIKLMQDVIQVAYSLKIIKLCDHISSIFEELDLS